MYNRGLSHRFVPSQAQQVGDIVTATATVTQVEGKKIEFKVEARCGDTLLGEGTHLRFIVDREKFMARV